MNYRLVRMVYDDDDAKITKITFSLSHDRLLYNTSTTTILHHVCSFYPSTSLSRRNRHRH